MPTDADRLLYAAPSTPSAALPGSGQRPQQSRVQRDICSSCIRFQRHRDGAGPATLRQRGYSGGNLNRPAMSELLAALEQGLVDVIVIYKLDRVNRPLSDFIHLFDLLDQDEVTFSSVPAQGGTLTSMTRECEFALKRKEGAMRFKLAFVACLVGGATPALAATTDCRSALVLSTYNKNSSRLRDQRLAARVTRAEYDEAKHNGGVSAVIYGVPVGANYDDFHKRSEQNSSSTNSSLKESEALNIMWTGLSANAASSYSACLRAEVGSHRGIHLSVLGATASDITLLVQYVVAGHDPNPARATWQPSPLPGVHWPTLISAGETIIIVPRPHVSRQVVIQVDGAASSVDIDPLPKPSPLPPPPPPPPTDSAFKVLPGESPPVCDSAGSPQPVQVPTRRGGLYNLALLRTANANASSLIPGFPLRHSISNLADGWYNNCRSWIPSGMPAWAEVDLGKPYIVSAIAFGSEFQPFYNDRAITGFSIRVATTPGSYSTVYTSAPGEAVSARREFQIPSQSVRFVRIEITQSSSDLPRIDEMEVYGKP